MQVIKRSILNRLINYNINDKVENVLYEVVVSIIDVLLCQLQLYMHVLEFWRDCF